MPEYARNCNHLSGFFSIGNSSLKTFLRFIKPIIGATTKETKVAKATNCNMLAPNAAATIKLTIAKTNTAIAKFVLFFKSKF